ncbi:MAG: hypothetical protein HYW70_00690 [Candidatus Nealsonbacteria bacterium]|nr:hypothetical protein [Candidatus Nealsonbacteria bacterium]
MGNPDRNEGLSLGDYVNLTIGASCWNCENHDGGWEVKGFDKKQWLYYQCKKCGYQTSFDKLGVPRNKPPCYGHYWEVAPNLRNLKTRGCVGIDGLINCPYWTLSKGGCPMAGKLPKIVNIPEERTVNQRHQVFQQ